MSFLRKFIFAGSVFLVAGCTLSASVDSIDKGNKSLASLNQSLTLLNAPTNVSFVTTLNATVTSTSSAFYKYKVGPFISTDCSVAAGYSGNIPLVIPMTDNIAAFPDQQMMLCVVGVSAGGVQESLSMAINNSWYLDRVPTLISITTPEQSVLETNGANQTITIATSVLKPYSITVDYMLGGDALYLIDYNLPTSGAIVIPAGTASVNILFQVLPNTGSLLSSYFQMNLLQTSNSLATLGSSYQTRFFINDVDGGARPTISVAANAMTLSNGTACTILSTGALKCWGTNYNGQVGNGAYVEPLSPGIIDSGTSYAQIALDTKYGWSACGITTTGVLKCWGTNSFGQVGDGTFSNKNVPTIVNAGTAYSQITISLTNCAITTTGVLKCWGRNFYGSVGDGTTVDKASLVVIDGGTNYSQVATSFESTCGITTTGVLKCWGANYTGSVGDGTLVAKSAPVLIDSGTAYSQINIGNRDGNQSNTVCGFTTAGVLKCWGDNGYGQLGDGTGVNKNIPTIIDAGTNYSQLSINSGNSCGITTTGVLKCWGRNDSGQVGDGTSVNKLSPVVIDGGTAYAQVTTRDFTTCAITTTGVLKCWGKNDFGQVGDGTLVNKLSPIVINSGSNYARVSTFTKATCGITTVGLQKCWGDNTLAQGGEGQVIRKSTISVIDSNTIFSKLGLLLDQSGTSCAITSTGVLKCWGTNDKGQLGDGTTTHKAAPVIIDAGVTYSKIFNFSNNSSYCGITTPGVLKCWGSNSYNQLGDGTSIDRTSPTIIDPGTSYSFVAGMYEFTHCGLTIAGAVKCWGDNSYGQMGDGTLIGKAVPTVVSGGGTYSKLIMFNRNACAITTAGVLKCWGANGSGVVGDGTLVDKLVPTVIDAGTSYSQITAGQESSSTVCGITTTGVLKCWGTNDKGQVGDGTLVNKTVPTIIDAGVNYNFVYATREFTCGITVAGVLKCWGANYSGQLGDGTGFDKATPTIIDAGINYLKIELTLFNSCGITVAGVLKCWGQEPYGDFGDGATNNKYSPIVVDSGTTYSSAKLTGHTLCGLTTAGILKCSGSNVSGTVGDGTTNFSYKPKNISKWLTP